MKTYTGSFFIVPNLALLVAGDRMYPDFATNDERIPTMSEFSIAVEVWITGEGCDNWTDHDGPLPKGYFPLTLIKDIKEGETLSFVALDRDGKEATFSLKAEQLKHRYRNHGEFHHLLRQVTSKTNYTASWGDFREEVDSIYRKLVTKAFK